MTTGIQIIEDERGQATGVYIPIKKWNQLKRRHKDLRLLDDAVPSKEQLLRELKESFKELQAIEKGKAKGRSAREFLKEL
jgi:hypothetical protein